MKNLEYYTKPINEFRETQCDVDLLTGKIKIGDVPLIFRGGYEYSAAHKYARSFIDEKERYYRYWKIAECMESDMCNLSMARILRENKKPLDELGVEIPEDSRYFNLETRILELQSAHEMYFEFATHKLFY